MSDEISDANVLEALRARADANEQAAARSPEHAAWSEGVAHGLREAIRLLEEEAARRHNIILAKRRAYRAKAKA